MKLYKTYAFKALSKAVPAVVLASFCFNSVTFGVIVIGGVDGFAVIFELEGLAILIKVLSALFELELLLKLPVGAVCALSRAGITDIKTPLLLKMEGEIGAP